MCFLASIFYILRAYKCVKYVLIDSIQEDL